MDGQNTSLFEDFYDLAAEQFNNVDWIPDSLVLPELHKDYSRSKPLPLNIVPITTELFKKKLNDNCYKMVKVIADWERSSTGAGMVNNIAEDELDKQAMQTQFFVWLLLFVIYFLIPCCRRSWRAMNPS